MLRHVTDLAEEADRLTHLSGDLALPLSELWVGGDLLDGAEQIEWALVVVRLDIPADEFPTWPCTPPWPHASPS